jgi:hypothetical protein
MVKMQTKYKVGDFEKWETGFRVAEQIRAAAGAKSAFAFREADDPDTVIEISEWDNADQAMCFSTSPAQQAVNRNSGLLSKPEVSFVGAKTPKASPHHSFCA